jgi:hypothetical protein
MGEKTPKKRREKNNENETRERQFKKRENESDWTREKMKRNSKEDGPRLREQVQNLRG